MKRQDAEKVIAKYEQGNCYVVPTAEIDSGKNGKAFEALVKLFLNNSIKTKNAVTSKGKIDTHFKGLKIEIKSACGTLDGIEKNDYVVYSPTSELENARVYTPNQFLDILNTCGLIRTKKSTSGYMVKAIQSFKNSKKKNAMFLEELKQGIELKQFKEMVEAQ